MNKDDIIKKKITWVGFCGRNYCNKTNDM